MKLRLLIAATALAGLAGCATYDYTGGNAGYYRGTPSVQYRYPPGYYDYGYPYYGGAGSIGLYGYGGYPYYYGNGYYRPLPPPYRPDHRPPSDHRPPPNHGRPPDGRPNRPPDGRPNRPPYGHPNRPPDGRPDGRPPGRPAPTGPRPSRPDDSRPPPPRPTASPQPRPAGPRVRQIEP